MSERPGELERFAFSKALDAAWITEYWIPDNPDYGYVDYFEAAATRNLGLLRGFEELAADVDRRGILPQTGSDQARLVTDGGRETLHFADGRLSIPEEIDASEGLVIRARGVTVDHKPGSVDCDQYPLSRKHLNAEDRTRNDHLEMFEVSLKPYGEDARRYDVQVLEADGGQVEDDTDELVIYNPEDAEQITGHLDHEGFSAWRFGAGELVDIHISCADCDVRWIIEDVPKDKAENPGKYLDSEGSI